MFFQDRSDAGRQLAKVIAEAPGLTGAVVLGLARGGVPVAFEVALACHLPLDVIVVRKLGAPRQPEFAMGAIASGGALVLNRAALREFHVSETQLQTLIEQQTAEMERLEHAYRQGRPPVEFAQGGVILVDDGLATGASMRAAVRAVRPRAEHVTIAVPVAAKSTCQELSREVDRVITVAIPERLEAVSLFYRDFSPTSDEEVRALLNEARERPESGNTGTAAPPAKDQPSGILAADSDPRSNRS